MLIEMPCGTCSKENRPREGRGVIRMYPQEVRDDARYEVVCLRGHRSIVLLQEQKFEVLFELGANAILDRYYREAVMSFTASLEQFYEFAIYVLCLHRGVASEFIDAAVKPISRAEPQLGAYSLLWLAEFGKPAVLMTGSDVERRNKVAHRGKIPSREEAITYGENVLGLIAPALFQLKETCNKALQFMIVKHLTKASPAGGLPGTATMSMSTAISIARANSEPQPSLAQTLEYLISYRERWTRRITD